ncbi:MAG: ribonuclease R [Eubacterium sp.]|nr:ribonuclease R [Eubacterium sp.]
MVDIINEKKKIILELMSDTTYVPMKFKELVVVLNVKKEDRPLLDIVLSELITEGKITLTKRGKYMLPQEEYIQGLFISNERGFGFVEVEGQDDDYFIPEGNVNGAFHHDMVLITVEAGQSGRRKEGKVVKILSHEITEVVGLFQKNKGFGYVLPDNQKISSDIYVAEKDMKGAVTGHKVVVRLKDYGSKGRKPEGEIIEILGHKNDPGVDILSVIKKYDIPEQFPEAVMEQVERIPDRVLESELNLSEDGRMDLRDLLTVTIDGEDAKDLDDAITLTKEDGYYKLGVHIADVSHYVKENSALDKEAVRRGTSVYLVDRVIPMLPHKLSNGICSLNQGEDRLALSCLMTIDEKGKIVNYQIAETLINVDHRMNYTEVNQVVSFDNPEVIAKYQDAAEMFYLMSELSDLLRERRFSRGSVDFDLPECKIKLDDQGRPIEIVPYDRNKATRIIEDFMLAANETVAECFYWLKIPFVYRNHEKPDEQRMDQLTQFIENFGYSVKKSDNLVHPKELQKLLTQIEGTPQEAMISRVTLRSMKRAEYTPQCIGHYGLAATYYCHFTSPIRRYPDLQIHRIIKTWLHNRMDDKQVRHYNSILPEVTKNCSAYERRADEAERDTEKMKKAEYMRSFIGEEYDGVISSVTGFGIYVELENTVEGLVHVSNMMDDHYVFDEATYSMTGERTRKTYKLGQQIRIRVEGADKMTGNVDFSIVNG